MKINEYVHARSEFLFVSLLVIFNFFPQINHFCYFKSLRALQDMENHCAHLRNIKLKTGRKIPFLRFPRYYSRYNMTGEHEIKKNKNKKNIYFLRIQKRKRKQKQAQKGMDEME